MSKILLLEPFYGGSHKQWADGLLMHSQHEYQLFSLKDQHWKWRMHGGAVTLARRFMDSNFQPDLILATDMLDVSLFLSLTRKRTAQIPVITYFHENQLTYPWSPEDADPALKRDLHYSFINFTTALSSDKVLFNSQYQLDAFLKELPSFLAIYPDHNEQNAVAKIRAKSEVLHLGLDLKSLKAFDPGRPSTHNRAVILWNNRWEYDKNPEGFFQALFALQDRGIEFKLIVAGEQTNTYPAIFDEARQRLKDFIIHFGYAESRAAYASLLYEADLLPITSFQDNFGGSVVEALYCNCIPLLPNRLAYPEHLPKAYQGSFFYQDEKDFVNRLQRQIMNVSILRKQKVRQFVEHYDWSEIIDQYDRVLETDR